MSWNLFSPATPNATASLPEIHRSIHLPLKATGWFGFFRKLFAFSGPGYLIAVGYMDPGNWATDLAGGSQFNYDLLSVIVISNFMAILLQYLSLKLGIATGRDLAQLCRDSYPRLVNYALWIFCEIAIAACDLAEVIGSAIALNLLFGLPLIWGVSLMACDVLLILLLQNRGFRWIEALVVLLILVIAGAFVLEMAYAQPDWLAVAWGCLPRQQIITNFPMLYVALGILGATVMPHNLYLHSSLAQTRSYELTPKGKREAIFFGTIDSTCALMFALLINAAILIVAAATFYRSGHHDVAAIEDAYKLLAPLLGVGMASTLFAIALLASGQNSTLTGTLAGQIVMEGFLQLRLPPFWRRLVTRAIAIIPAIIVTALYGERGTGQLLILSQVVLSLQLSFAVIPLVLFTSDKKKMGEFVNSKPMIILAWITAIVIAALNSLLLFLPSS